VKENGNIGSWQCMKISNGEAEIIVYINAIFEEIMAKRKSESGISSGA